MRQMELGKSGLQVSEWCLGTMTYGTQTSQDDAHRQMDMSVAAGINFIDTAELYPVNPISAKTVGLSEQIVGNWLQGRGRRDDVVVASKITGPNGGFVRDGAGFNDGNIREVVEASLRRLQTDYIDLYQLHWPDRGSYGFRQNWTFDPSKQDRAGTLAHMDKVLSELAELVAEGKIRAFGLSNESAWGTTRWIDRAEVNAGPRVCTMQNEYSLMCRLYDTDMAEVAVNEDVTLLAFSPLATGILTGKYLDGVIPEGSRRSIEPALGGRASLRMEAAARAYVELAASHGIDPVHMAIAWHRTRPFPSLPIFGATTTAQLQHIIDGKDVVLAPSLIEAIDQVHMAHPMPY